MITTRNRLNQATLATAISLAIGHACADAVPRGKIRLALNSEISSRPEIPPVEKFDGRISVSGLIQSHPNPLYLVLEKRYKALPPFTMAEEDIPGELIAVMTSARTVSLIFLFLWHQSAPPLNMIVSYVSGGSMPLTASTV